MFVRRLGSAPANRGSLCRNTFACPDIWELDDGDFAVIGADITEHAGKLPPTAGCASHERMVRVPRRLLILAKRDIPDAL